MNNFLDGLQKDLNISILSVFVIYFKFTVMYAEINAFMQYSRTKHIFFTNDNYNNE